MGYQESFVRLYDSNKFEELLQLTKDLGAEFFEYSGAKPVEIITLKKAIKGTLFHQGHRMVNYSFPVGEKFIYFVGDRSPQRNSRGLFHNKVPEGLEIYFSECFPTTKIFDSKSRYADHEALELNSNSAAYQELKKITECETNAVN
jgi:hypothetical protein